MPEVRKGTLTDVLLCGMQGLQSSELQGWQLVVVGLLLFFFCFFCSGAEG